MQPPSAQHAPARSTSEAQDADEHAHNLTNWQQEYDQLGDGRFYGRIDEVTLDGFQLFKEHTNRALRQQCNVWKDSVWLGIPAQPADCRINGLSVDSNQLMCRPGDCDFELMTPNAFDIFGIVVKADILLGAAEREGRMLDLASLEQSPRLAVAQQQLDQLRYLLEQMVIHNKSLNVQIQQDLVTNALLDLFTENRTHTDTAPSFNHRKQVVDKVKAHIAANPDTLVTVTDLCELAHVSRRTLQYSFESILGISPLKFLRTARLNQVRRALSMPQQDGSIAVIAASWGFWHPGQFALDYKALFGEKPSETVKRVRQ
ncbi:helix-turn-helix domain-containing protein [uncultured Halopseudomonas sp.]|uniref:helix-turn-helix domain-containing protein n=1 Tax=uncultured Halopseudomonas sp. TaxID=2901193 RepID=UPI0030EB187C|tara:strand:+ start:7184 stop:8131 length:948 start_codon:yes stop_codon:yes gene_type:complete